MANKLEFVLFDPAIAGEKWAQGYFEKSRKVNSVKILIDDVDLLHIVERIEKQNGIIDREYGHATAEGLYYELTDEEGYFLPLCCSDCGETGCCTFEGKWRQDGEWVYWECFSSQVLGDYKLNFRFAKVDYDIELKKLV